MARKFQVTRGCTYCGMCVMACPAGAIAFTEDGACIDVGACTGCGACEDNCASEAIVEIAEKECTND